MVQEHLSQAHDAASRRAHTIDAPMAWIHASLLGGETSSVLDLGCGPGLYCQRLAAQGHTCTGIDFSPASIDYARGAAERAGCSIAYQFDDLRRAPFGAGHALAMLLFGECSVFPDHDLHDILHRAAVSLRPSGHLLIEAHPFAAVKALGHAPVHTFSSPGGLWSDRPHHGVRESFWDAESATATQRYVLVDEESGAIRVSCASYQARTEDQYRALIHKAGLQHMELCSSLGGPQQAGQED
jgi:SAM-dependent methyltransferase